ncbi:Oidioi.mRNA.OKI2018_I69.YSR.g17127.t1.cds [Oikopleura dioica]|uniref:Oidioi.mRNA.OKI2018_I69.YSR.g17127.t1.cds n=1 Tax=Oikopleura dioica TaxID=34765 RepID=A0ABN7SIS1_OIKDI|nr:Oidioi.mRNA.OKI2018_I69.YSR.g17127.t1.cds [Oikopleura dioica]
MVFRIHEAAELHNIDLRVDYVNTKEQLADEPSRTFDFNGKEITDEAFDEISRAWPQKFTLDAFATKENARTERYISRFHDDQAWASDFFRFTKLRHKEHGLSILGRLRHEHPMGFGGNQVRANTYGDDFGKEERSEDFEAEVKDSSYFTFASENGGDGILQADLRRGDSLDHF